MKFQTIKNAVYLFLVASLLFFFSCATQKKTDESSGAAEETAKTEETKEAEISGDELSAQGEPETEDNIEEDTSLTDESSGEQTELVEEEQADDNLPAVVETKPETETETVKDEQVTPSVPEREIAQTPPVQPTQTTPTRPEARVPPQDRPVVPVPGPAEERPPENKTESPPRDTPRQITPVIDIPFRDESKLPHDGEIVFSRVVRATVGQTVEIPFRGTGWVYLGELASRRGIVYNSRRNEPEGQSFIFRAEEAGTYALKFFKQDFIRDYILNDHVQVIVGDAPVTGAGWFNSPFDRGRVIAEPRWPTALEEAEIQRGGSPGSKPAADRAPIETPSGIAAQSGASAQGIPAQGTPSQERAQPPVTENQQRNDQPPERQQTVDRPQTAERPPPEDRPQLAEGQQTIETPQDSAAAEKKLSPQELIEKAKEAFDGGNAAAAIALLDQYAQYFPGGTDELYWLYGQFYEANTPSRNILLSLDYYRRLVNEYPQSSRYSDARRRIAYLERFYINIQ